LFESTVHKCSQELCHCREVAGFRDREACDLAQAIARERLPALSILNPPGLPRNDCGFVRADMTTTAACLDAFPRAPARQTLTI